MPLVRSGDARSDAPLTYWTPGRSDPRYSRRTPDALLARVEAALSGNRVGGADEWVSRIFAGNVRRMSKYDPRRKRLLDKLEAKAVTVEKKRAEKMRKVEISTPKPAPLLKPEEETASMYGRTSTIFMSADVPWQAPAFRMGCE